MTLDTNWPVRKKVWPTTVRNVAWGCHLKDAEHASVEEKML